MALPDSEWSFTAAFHFSVSINDKPVSFCEVSGIECTLDVDPVVSGGDSSHSYYVPKSRKYSDLVLKRGVVKGDDDFFVWCKEILSTELTKGGIKPKNLLVSLLNEGGEELVTWSFTNAYPVKWSLGAFNADKSEVALETVTLKYYSFDVQKKVPKKNESANK
jgi:phage tail-like protein